MALPGGFGLLTPLGLLALAALVPIVVLYLVQPDPRRVELPTLRFLLEESDRDASHPLLERLKRSLLLLLQVLLVALLAVSLAGPYVAVDERTTVEETVLVVDASASMATTADGDTRFERAIGAAGDEATGTTSIVVAAGEGRIPLRQGAAEDARTTLESLTVTDTEGDLRAAIAEAAAIAGEDAQILVYSDFAGGDAWSEAVQSARARGLRVELHQFAAGGADNVGIVDRSFSGRNVTLTVANYGDAPVERTLALGDQRRTVALDPGDATGVTLTVPPGGGEAALSPRDSFPTDDVAHVAAPAEATIDVLVLTNDRNRYLLTALSVIDTVDLTVDEPPTTVEGDYDVIVYSNVEAERLLRGNVEAGQAVLEDGGGVAVQAQAVMPDRYGDLSLLEPAGTARNPVLARPAADELTRDISFPPPEEYRTGSLREGRTLVGTQAGTPLIATAQRDAGRLLYYGYIEDRSTFKFNYQYPVFWKRAVHFLAGRDPLPALNRETGSRLQFANETAVETPAGPVRTTSLTMDRAGFYRVGNRRLGASLYSQAESAVDAEPLEDRRSAGEVPAREEQRQVPRPIAGLVALGALAVALGEVAYLRRRGDL